MDFEAHLIPPERWDELYDEMPIRCRDVVDECRTAEPGRPKSVSIGRSDQLGWFIVCPGQWPALVWWERKERARELQNEFKLRLAEIVAFADLLGGGKGALLRRLCHGSGRLFGHKRSQPIFPGCPVESGAPAFELGRKPLHYLNGPSKAPTRAKDLYKQATGREAYEQSRHFGAQYGDEDATYQYITWLEEQVEGDTK